MAEETINIKATRRRWIDGFVIRMNPDGTVRGAHQEVVEQLILANGSELGTSSHTVEPVSVNALAAILGQERAAVVAQITKLQSDLEAAQRDAAVTLDALHRAQAVIESQTKQLEAIATPQ